MGSFCASAVNSTEFLFVSALILTPYNEATLPSAGCMLLLLVNRFSKCKILKCKIISFYSFDILTEFAKRSLIN